MRGEQQPMEKIIKKSELEEKYNSMTQEALAKELGISIPRLRRILKKEGIFRERLKIVVVDD